MISVNNEFEKMRNEAAVAYTDISQQLIGRTEEVHENRQPKYSVS